MTMSITYTHTQILTSTVHVVFDACFAAREVFSDYLTQYPGTINADDPFPDSFCLVHFLQMYCSKSKICELVSHTVR